MSSDEGRGHVLLVEMHEALRSDLSRALERSGFSVAAFASVCEARRWERAAPPSVRVVDARAEGLSDWLEAAGPERGAIVLHARAESPSPVSDVGGDRIERLCKPFSIQDLESRILARLAERAGDAMTMLDPLLRSRDPELRQVLARARRLARGDLPVAIEGELGTGRRSLAEAIHAWSPRAGQPLVVLEPAMIEALGAAGVADRLDEESERAAEGTLVIVEPSRLPLASQDLLARCLREGESAGPRRLTIASEPLEQSLREGRLSLELGYRLDAARVLLPPLRDRGADHAELCRAMARRVARELGRATPEIDAALVARLASDGFPGNRLGLESRLRSALIRCEEGERRIDAFLDADPGSASESRTATRALNLKQLERDTIVRALAHWDGNRTRASESLGISVRTLRNKIREYGLR